MEKFKQNLMELKTVKLAVILMICAFQSYAQDIITLKTGENIKAKVEEISSTEVKYKRFDNLQGPIFVLIKNEIFSIKYENGETDVFNSQVKTSPVKQESESKKLKSYDEINTMKDSELLAYFLMYEKGSIYDKFYKGYYLRNLGKGFLTGGLIFTGVGIICLVAGYVAWDEDSYWYGYLATSIGILGTVVSIPLIISGNNKKKGAKFDYKNKYFNQNYSQLPTLNFGLTSNGLGVTLKF